jgi:carbon starvation protein
MNVLVLFILAIAFFILASRFYSNYIAKTLGVDPNRPTPAVQKNDGRDYVPTKLHVLFAHHFSAIAGAGPIVGPTMALLYGVVPGWLYVRRKKSWFTVLPAIFMILTTVASLLILLWNKYLPQKNYILISMDFLLLICALGVAFLAVRTTIELVRKRGLKERLAT